MKVYITLYALTKGILEKEAEICTGISDNMVRDKTPGYNQCFHKPFWHLAKEEAVAHAEQMRTAKLASLKKQQAKLEKLTF